MKPVPPSDNLVAPKVARSTPRRIPGTMGRRPEHYPDLNFAQLALDLDISPTYLSRVMNGVVRPSIGLAERLAALMGWSIDQVNDLYKSRHVDGQGRRRRR